MEEEKTQSGIENWHLGVPTWAEGAKPSYMKSRRKTVICQQWLDARKDRKAPQGAPPWWGCPRGRGCDFAHGKVNVVAEIRVPGCGCCGVETAFGRFSKA